MQPADALGVSQVFSAGQPVAKRKSDELDYKAYRVGAGTAFLYAERQKLEEEKRQFAMQQAQILQMIMQHQIQMGQQQAMAQQQGAYEGSYQAASDHLGGYSDNLAGMLGGGSQGGQQPGGQQMMM